jgi:hypothetical protein
VTITRDNNQGEASVNYSTQAEAATNQVDYTGISWKPLVFRDGQTSKTITIYTLADDINEPDETFRVNVNTDSEGYTMSRSRSIVTIHDTTVPNAKPFISGSPPASVVAESQYRFAVTASDNDSDQLTYSVTRPPEWASFNEETGVLSGRPSLTDVGTYSNITISVHDETNTTSLSPFSITVLEPEPGVGSVSLAWNPPTTRTDGSVLDMSEIGGYKVYMGETANNLEQVMDLADSTISEHVIENLETGEYYFAVTTYDNDGNESNYSNVVLKSTM